MIFARNGFAPLLLGLAICWTGAAALAQSKPAPVAGQKAPQELVALLDLEALGATRNQAAALTDRLREELLKSGRYTLVDRSQMDAVLKEQALQQEACITQECAVKVGKLLGVRKIIAGRVNRVEDDLWVLSCQMVDVETAQTLRAESVEQEGKFRAVFGQGVPTLAARLTGVVEARQVAAVSPSPGAPPAAQKPAGAARPAPGGASAARPSSAAFQAWLADVKQRKFTDKDYSAWMNNQELLAHAHAQNGKSVPVRIQIQKKGNKFLHRVALVPVPTGVPVLKWQWRTAQPAVAFDKMDADMRTVGYVLASLDKIGGDFQKELNDGLWLKAVVK